MSPHPVLVRLRRVLPVVVACVSAPGCLDNRCEQIDENPVRYTGGHTSSDDTFYQSSRADEPFLRFPAARKFRLEHQLRSTPVEVNIVLSFDRDGSSQALAAGNEARLTVTRDYIEVYNDTCADFFVRVTAWSEPLPPVDGSEGNPDAKDATAPTDAPTPLTNDAATGDR